MTLDEHLLTCLGEEGCEVSQAVSKSLRFGLPDVNVLKPNGPSNRERIVEELNDLMALVEICVYRGLLPEDWKNREAREEKKAKVMRYTELGRKNGVLHEVAPKPTAV